MSRAAEEESAAGSEEWVMVLRLRNTQPGTLNVTGGRLSRPTNPLTMP